MSMFRGVMSHVSRNNVFLRSLSRRQNMNNNFRRNFGGAHKTVPGQLQVRFSIFEIFRDDDERCRKYLLLYLVRSYHKDK